MKRKKMTINIKEAQKLTFFLYIYIYIYIVQFSYSKDVSNHNGVILIKENSIEVCVSGVNKVFLTSFYFLRFFSYCGNCCTRDDHSAGFYLAQYTSVLRIVRTGYPSELISDFYWVH